MHYKATLVLAIAGLVSARSVHHKKQATPALPAGWAAVGCYTDSWDRTLATQVSANNNQLTTESCLTACNGYTFAGTENGDECYCSSALASTGTKAADGDCSVNCSGGGGLCGGGWRLSVYQYTAATWPDPPFIPYISPPPGWINAGCYSDSWTRTLANPVSVSGLLSRESCTTACDSAGYIYAGLENGDECWCSNSVASTGVITSDEDCSMPCPGNSAETCGGGWRVNIFQKEGKGTLFWPLSGWSSLGCYTDSWNRTLTGPSYTSNSPDIIISAADCIRSCLLQGYKYAGAENGNECHCGHGIATTGVRAPDEDCRTPCVADTTHSYFCGGGWRLSIYHDNYN